VISRLVLFIEVQCTAAAAAVGPAPRSGGSPFDLRRGASACQHVRNQLIAPMLLPSVPTSLTSIMSLSAL
jgi:hypothetical protein